MGSQDQHCCADCPPSAPPGDTVRAAFRGLGLSWQDWSAFQQEVARCRQWAASRHEAKLRTGCHAGIPYWDDRFSAVIRDAAQRARRTAGADRNPSAAEPLSAHGPAAHFGPSWVLLDAYAAELEAQDI